MSNKYLMIMIILFSFSFVLYAQNGPDTLWTNVYGGVGDDFAHSAIALDDNSFVITGSKNSEFWISKVDNLGNVIWERIYSSIPYQCGYSVQNTTDGGFIIAGEYSNTPQLMKLDENGYFEWQQIYNYTGDATSVKQTVDGGYILVGDDFIIKTDADGNIEWNDTHSNEYNAKYVEQTNDNGFIVIGTYICSTHPHTDVVLWKFDLNGNIQWQRMIGNGYEDGIEVHQTSDNGYVLLSFSEDELNCMLTKTDNLGNIEWNHYYGSEYTIPGSMKITSDGGYIIAASAPSTQEGFWITKTDSNGVLEWNETYSNDFNSVVCSIQQTFDNGFIIAGTLYTYIPDRGKDCKLVRLLPTNVTNLNPNILPNSLKIENLNNYPNPFNPFTNIKFSISFDSEVELVVYNIKGHIVKTLLNDKMPCGEHSIIWNGKNENNNFVSSGVYFYSLIINSKTTLTKKCILLK